MHKMRRLSPAEQRAYDAGFSKGAKTTLRLMNARFNAIIKELTHIRDYGTKYSHKQKFALLCVSIKKFLDELTTDIKD